MKWLNDLGNKMKRVCNLGRKLIMWSMSRKGDQNFIFVSFSNCDMLKREMIICFIRSLNNHQIGDCGCILFTKFKWFYWVTTIYIFSKYDSKFFRKNEHMWFVIWSFLIQNHFIFKKFFFPVMIFKTICTSKNV